MRIGDYQLEDELATTATATLYRAIHQVLPRHALIKIARRAVDSVTLLREACILAALPHPGIIRIHETGRIDQRVWFASEIVEGMTLAEIVVLGSIEAALAVGMIRDVAEILAYAHQRGVVHGGIAPSRLVMTGHGRGFPMCITDWSSARPHDATPMPVEITPYVAPELVRNEPHTIDDRADVFALGVIAYRALTGVLPFDAVATDADGGVQHVPTEVRCPDVPHELTNLVDQMLAFDRWDRPSCAEVREQLGVLAGMLEPSHQPQLVRIRRPRWTPPLTFAEPATADRPTLDLDDLELERS